MHTHLRQLRVIFLELFVSTGLCMRVASADWRVGTARTISSCDCLVSPDVILISGVVSGFALLFCHSPADSVLLSCMGFVLFMLPSGSTTAE